MSYTELHVGKLQKIDLGLKFIDQYLEEQGIEYDKDERHVVDDKGNILYFIKDGILYKNVVVRAGESEEYLSHGTIDEDGNIDYVIQFYNGGTWEGEMLEDLVDELNNK